MLSWNLIHGKHWRKIEEDCLRTGRPFPKFLEEKPELEPGLEIYFRGWWELTTDRPLGVNGESWIPWSSVRLYCKELELTAEQTESMHFLLRKMDEVYLNHVRKQK